MLTFCTIFFICFTCFVLSFHRGYGVHSRLVAIKVYHHVCYILSQILSLVNKYSDLFLFQFINYFFIIKKYSCHVTKVHILLL